MSIADNQNRIGKFTSSEVYKLMTNGKGAKGFGAPAITYIEEKNIELKMGRIIKTDVHTRPIAWGNFIELYVFDLLPFGYEWVSDKTVDHPEITSWAGSTDYILPGEKIAELKCYEPKNFSQYTEAILSEDLQRIKENHPAEYWQLVSNAIINKADKAEAITFMPYQSELSVLRELAENYDGHDQWKYRFISESEDASLPYLPDGGFYQNLNTFEFEVPKEDIEALTDRVILASSLLIQTVGMIATHDPEMKTTIIESIKLQKI